MASMFSRACAVAMCIGMAPALHATAAAPAAVVTSITYQAGIEQASIPDDGHAPIGAVIFYPTMTEAHSVNAGPVTLNVAPRAPVVAGVFPLIIISHGTGAGAFSHVDTAQALAHAGYVVIALTHTGDNYMDDSIVGHPAWLVDRSRHITRAIDYMLGTWTNAASIDPHRVGIFGFSAGGTTALVTMGAELDFSRLTANCASKPEFVCRLYPNLNAVSSDEPLQHDPRIRAAVIAAPGLGFVFNPGTLKRVKVPLQLWAATNDETVPYDSNSAVIRAHLGTPPEFHQVEGAGHLSFLAPCEGVSAVPAICTDRAGFDRAAFHEDFNAKVVGFFGRTLGMTR